MNSLHAAGYAVASPREAFAGLRSCNRRTGQSCAQPAAHPKRLPDAVCVHAAGHILNELASEVHRQVACVLNHLCKDHTHILACQ